MTFSMSGVDDGWSYNRFDMYEKKAAKKDDCPKCEGECECENVVKKEEQAKQRRDRPVKISNTKPKRAQTDRHTDP